MFKLININKRIKLFWLENDAIVYIQYYFLPLKGLLFLCVKQKHQNAFANQKNLIKFSPTTFFFHFIFTF